VGFNNATIATVPPGSSLSIVGTVPTTSGGDALFAMYNADEVTTPLTTSSDFTLINAYQTSAYDNNSAGIFSYTANGGAGFPSSGGPTTYTFTTASQAFPSTSLLLMSWTGVTVTPTDAQPTVISTQHITPTSATLNGVTAGAGDQLLIFIGGDAISSASDVFSATATGYTQKVNGGDGFSPVIVLASTSPAAGGATGTIAVSITSVPSGEDFGGVIAWVVAMPASGGTTPVSDPPWGAAHRMRRNTLLRMSPPGLGGVCGKKSQRVSYAGQVFTRKPEHRLFHAQP
jgi:hypothetical protein